MSTTRWSRWLREPILHFALIGALLFFVYGRMNPGVAAGERIVVTQAIVDDLARQHQARWMRPPSEQELANLVEAHVRDEILFREGVALGLDRDDPVIKRRVRQKFEVMSEEQLAGAAPTDAELSDYMAQNADRFTRPARVSFEQIFFDGSRTAPEVERAVAAAKARWRAAPTRPGSGSRRCCRAARRPRRSIWWHATSAPPSPSSWTSCRTASGSGRWPRAWGRTWCASPRVHAGRVAAAGRGAHNRSRASGRTRAASVRAARATASCVSATTS